MRFENALNLRSLNLIVRILRWAFSIILNTDETIHYFYVAFFWQLIIPKQQTYIFFMVY